MTHPRRDRLRLWGASMLPWWTLGAIGMYMKFVLMEGYWTPMARMMRLASADQISALTRLSLYAQDVLFNLVLVPVSMSALLVAFCKRPTLWSHLLAAALGMLYFFQLQTQQQVGQYVSVDLLIEAFRWAASNPASGLSYVPVGALLKLGLLWGAGLVASVLYAHWVTEKRGRVLSATHAGVLVGSLALASGAFVLNALAHKGELYQASAVKMFMSLKPSVAPSALAEADASAHAAHQFRQLTRTPDVDQKTAHLGQAKDANVLLFVLETGAKDVFERDENPLSDVSPELGARALTLTNHKTSYPYTSDALFSILSGLYPEGRRTVVARGNRQTVPSLMGPLAARNYLTKAFMPDLYNDEVDDRMFGALGFDAQYVADRVADERLLAHAQDKAERLAQALVSQAPHFKAARRQELVRRLTLDIMALDALKADIVGARQQGRRFGYLFLPQIGHAPWFELGEQDTPRSHGKAMVKLQTQWINELSELLAQQQLLDKTVLLVTADHGVRTRKEDPTLNVGTTDSYSFSVPLMLYAPKAWPSPQSMGHVTSHVDIAPSILALLGLEHAASSMEGGPLWALPHNRRTYFFATGYGGAVGFHETRYVMHNVMSGFVYASPDMHFEHEDMIGSANPTQEQEAIRAFDEFHALHGRIVKAMLH